MGDEPVSETTCARDGCTNPGTVSCVYVDRRGRACPDRWCGNHAVEVNGQPYCARHASTMIAIGDDLARVGRLPEIDNRVPSLVYWVGRNLDSDVPVVLATLIDERANESLVVDPVALIAGGGALSERRWERNWKVVSHTGISQKVTLQVLEGDPTDVVLRVGRVVVARETPPWIAAREAGHELPPEEDAAERHAFYRRLHDAMTAALEAQQAPIYR